MEKYWVNTSETSLDIVRGFLGKTAALNESFENLLAGKTILSGVQDNLPYHKIHEDAENLWSVLVETGYLTKAVTERMARMPLRIPNRGIQAVFRQEVWELLQSHTDHAAVHDFEHAMWASDLKQAEETLNMILESTLSFYHEYHEYSYHLILDGLFTGMEYRVISELETGYGRSDLIIPDPALGRCMILELKHVKEESELEKALYEAKSQIIDQKYESRMKFEGYATRLRYGMAFCGKRVLIGICD